MEDVTGIIPMNSSWPRHSVTFVGLQSWLGFSVLRPTYAPTTMRRGAMAFLQGLAQVEQRMPRKNGAEQPSEDGDVAALKRQRLPSVSQENRPRR